MANLENQLYVRDLKGSVFQEIAIDFITTNLPPRAIIQKFNITRAAFYHLRDQMNLEHKRIEFQRRVKEKVEKRSAQDRARALLLTIKIISKHLERIEKAQRSKKEPLPSEIINDVIRIYGLIAQVSDAHKKQMDQIERVFVEMSIA